ncbi:MAG: hypothetical protein ABJA98_24140 [Acidobacteriota bacterium]
MGVIRSRIVAVALVLLAWQAAVVCVAPVALCPVNATNGATEDAACTCDHADGGICPMHGTRTPSSRSHSSRPHWCAGCGDGTDVMIQTLIAASGALPSSRHRVIAPAEASEGMTLVAAVLPVAVRSPLAPPPRS